MGILEMDFERILGVTFFYSNSHSIIKSVNLKYITVGRLDDDMIVPPSDGAMFILID